MMDTWVSFAGLVQLAIAVGSLALPHLLGWREQVARLDGLLRCVFWTYAGYILGTNVCFGLVSVLAPHWLTDGSALARSVCAFIAMYWAARILLQVLVFHRHSPPGRWYRFGETALGMAFAFCTAVYSAVALGMA